MSQTETLLSASTTAAAGTGVAVPADSPLRSFVASIAGTGAVSATVAYEVSNDNGTTWAPRLTFSLSGTTTAVLTDVDECSPFPLVRGNVTAISGTGATVKLSMSAV